MSRVDTLFAKAKQAEGKGDFPEADRCYRAILERFPGNVRARKALDGLQAALSASQPQDALGRLLDLYRQGALAQCIAEGEAMLAADGGSFALNDLLGAAHIGLGRFAQAERAYRRAAAIDSAGAEVHYNLGVALQEQGKAEEALAAYGNALARKPGHAAAQFNAGNALLALGRLQKAVEAFERAAALSPGHAAAYYNLGNALNMIGRADAAVAAYRAAVAARPDYAEAHANLGLALERLGQWPDAEEAFRRAAILRPEDVEAQTNLAGILRMRAKLDEAIDAYDRALALKPDSGTILAQKLHQQAHICDWSAHREFAAVAARLGVEGDRVSPFSLLAFEDDPERQLARSIRWAEGIDPPAVADRPPAAARRDDRIRIGYFSADFHDHATMHLMSGLFREHDRRHFDIRVYSYGQASSGPMRTGLVAAVDGFVDIAALPDGEAAARAREDALDIAIDLKGYTFQSRSGLFAQRLAPVHVNYLGYPGPMGARFIDYMIADRIVAPSAPRLDGCEKIVRLPGCYQPNDDRRAIAPSAGTRADHGLPERGIVFCSFNNSYKIGPGEFDVWMALLGQVEGSVLWLLRANPWAEANLRREADARGVDPERLRFAGRVSQAQHLARHAHADLFLDSFAYNAHTTASDALWAGLPLVTRQGRQFAARVGASLLHAVGLPDLITETTEGYAALALALATDPARLAAIRARLAENRRTWPLFDTVRHTRDLETAYRRMHARHIAGEGPVDMDIGDGAR